MAYMIENAGLWNIEAEDYHADPCPQPSLSASIATVLLDQCPRKAWQAHPRLNPGWQPADPEKRLDFGTVVHTLLLGKGKDFHPIDAANYKTKQAQVQRDTVREMGRVPILVGELDRARAMVKAAREQLAESGGEHVFNPQAGKIELMIAALDRTGVWGRRLCDFYGDRIKAAVEIWDYKTVQTGSANPEFLASRILDLDYATACAMTERLLLTLKPELAGRLKFRFLFQEAEEPYLVSAVDLLEDAMQLGRKRVAAAFAIWSKCLKSNSWPGYPKRVVPVALPVWAEKRWTEWELAHAEEISGDPYLEASPWISAGTGTLAPQVSETASQGDASHSRRRSKGAKPAQGTLLDAG